MLRASLTALCLVLGCSDPPSPPPTTAADASPAPTPIDVTAPVSEARPAAPAPTVDAPEQHWLGRVTIPNAPALVVELKFDPDVIAAATLAIPAQKVPPTALVDVAISPTSMAFTLPIPGADDRGQARFTVALVEGSDTATGTLVQAGLTMPLTMRRMAQGETLAEALRPQTPKPPFPYALRDAVYTSADGTTLAGTMTLPSTPGKHPAVVLISGTGEQDRDMTLGDHRFFAVVADHLTRAGIAVLRVDDRGVGGSGGNTSETGFDGKVEDVVAGMAWLAVQPEIDAARVGLVGHSEGGLIGPLVAVRARPPAIPVAFLVLLAAPGVPTAELMITQMDQTLRAQRVSAERLAVGNAGQQRVLEAVLSGADDAALRVIVTEQLDAIFALTPDNKPGFLGRRAQIESALLQVATPAMRDFIRAEPGPTLAQVRCPVIAMGGTMDLQVDGETNLAAIRAALERGKNPDITTVLVPGRNHLFQPAAIGTPEEWASIDTTIDPAVLAQISDWVRVRAAVDHASAQ